MPKIDKIKVNNILYDVGGGGVPVTINQPASATNGNLSAEQLATLQANDLNYIVFNNEIFSLNDKTHTADTLTYSHVGYENGKHLVKTISITISTKAWVMNTAEIGGGGAIKTIFVDKLVSFGSTQLSQTIKLPINVTPNSLLLIDLSLKDDDNNNNGEISFPFWYCDGGYLRYGNVLQVLVKGTKCDLKVVSNSSYNELILEFILPSSFTMPRCDYSRISLKVIA